METLIQGFSAKAIRKITESKYNQKTIELINVICSRIEEKASKGESSVDFASDQDELYSTVNWQRKGEVGSYLRARGFKIKKRIYPDYSANMIKSIEISW